MSSHDLYCDIELVIVIFCKVQKLTYIFIDYVSGQKVIIIFQWRFIKQKILINYVTNSISNLTFRHNNNIVYEPN